MSKRRPPLSKAPNPRGGEDFWLQWMSSQGARAIPFIADLVFLQYRCRHGAYACWRRRAHGRRLETRRETLRSAGIDKHLGGSVKERRSYFLLRP